MIYDITSDSYVAVHPVTARTFWMRLTGLIGKKFDPEKLDAMVFERCNAIHTCWMSMPIDLLFLDCGNAVVSLHESLRPWRLASGGIRAVTAIELPAGRISGCGVRKGDILNLNSTLNPEKVEKSQVGIILNESAYPMSKSRMTHSAARQHGEWE